jgi:predicted acyl esterase
MLIPINRLSPAALALLLLACGARTEHSGLASPDAAGAPSRDAGTNPLPDGGPIDAGCAAGTLTTATGTCSTEATLLLPMRDGVTLKTLVFLPKEAAAARVPTVMIRSPYRNFDGYIPFYDSLARFFAGRGYAAVLQDCRRDPGADAVFHPFTTEIEDGKDTTTWIAQQPWSTGKIGTFGGSYDGYTALAAAVDNPTIAAVVADDAVEDFSFERSGGAADTHIVEWLYFLHHAAWPSSDQITMMSAALDLQPLDQKVLGRTDPQYQAFLAMDVPAPTPEAGTLLSRYDRICAPVLTLNSETGSPIAEHVWRSMETVACPAIRGENRLILTPDPHTFHSSSLPTMRTEVNQRMLDFLDRYVAGKSVDLPPQRIEYASVGETMYQQSMSFPGAHTEELPLGWVSGDMLGILGTTASASIPLSSITSDPSMMDACMNTYPSLIFGTSPFAAPLRLFGDPRLEIDIEATTPDLDLFAYLVDFDPVLMQQVSVGLGMVRARYRNPGTATPLSPNTITHLSIPLGTTGHQFSAGHQAFLWLGNAFCGFFKNPDTGDAFAQSQTTRPTSMTIHYGPTTKLILPLP